MVEDEKPKQLQMRKTAEDVARCQDIVYGIIKNKIRENSLLSYSEREMFIRLVRDAVGSYGTFMTYLRPKEGYPVFELSLMRLAYLLLECKTTTVTLSDGMNQGTFQIRELWQVLLNLLMDAYPRAISEARHMSPETDLTSGGRPRSFTFSSDSFKTEDK